MPNVSVIIPTHNRPELLKRAIASVQAQTYRDFELIVIEDRESKGGGWARNQGIKKTHGKFIAFLDDDDEWLPEKLEVQMRAFEQTPEDVGFCFSAVINVYEDREQRTQVLDGLDWYADRAIDIKYFSDFLTVTLVVKRAVFDMVGVFDEALPSHQELDFIIRTSKRYRGLGLNVPLVRVNMKNNTPRIGTNLDRRIAGRLRVIEKNFTEIQKHPGILAAHYFALGLLYRDNRYYQEAHDAFKLAFKSKFSFRYLLHYGSMMMRGFFYDVFIR